jgi:CHASE3 domain sensor protein
MSAQTTARRWWVNLPIGYKGLLVISLPLVGLIATFVVRLPLSEKQQETAALLARSAEMRGRAQELLVALLDSETAARGFVLTRDATFLTPFEQAQARVPATIDALGSVVDRQTEGAAFAQAARHSRRRAQLASEIVSLGRAGAEANDPRVRQLLSEGKVELEAGTAAIDGLLARQQAGVDRSQSELERVRQWLSPIIWATFIGSFIAAGMAIRDRDRPPNGGCGA